MDSYREIRYRGWNYGSGGYVYGGVVKYDEKKMTIVGPDGMPHVCPTRSVGVCTGIEDKTGCKIYEDDIVSIELNGEIRDGLQVCFDKSDGRYWLYNQKYDWIPMDDSDGDHIEIQGSVFEEYLKSAENILYPECK